MAKLSLAHFDFERNLLRRGLCRIAGVDEAGRGPLAGPVVAAAAVLPRHWIEAGLPRGLRGLNDSKLLSPECRADFFAALTDEPLVHYGIAIVEAEVIDHLNILRATHLVMVRALAQLDPVPDHVLVDGLRVGPITHPQTPLVQGDRRSYSIAAASILAKVTRDRLMIDHDRRWPAYGFARHKGYPTPQHLLRLAKLGPCPLHRRSFAPVSATQIPLFSL